MTDPTPPNSLFKEIAETKERLVAWLFRGLISVIMLGASTIGYMSWDALKSMQSKIDDNGKATWQAIAKVANDEGDAAKAVAVLSATITDEIRSQSATNQDLRDIVRDHEQRLRGLEHPVH